MSMKKNLGNVVKVLLAGALAVSLLPLPAFAGELKAGGGVSSAPTVSAKVVKTQAKKVKISKAQIKIDQMIGYTGKAVKPGVKVVYKGKALKKGRDYIVGYLNSKKKAIKASKVKKAGTYYVKLKGKGKFKGTKTVKFTIEKAATSDDGDAKKKRKAVWHSNIVWRVYSEAWDELVPGESVLTKGYRIGSTNGDACVLENDWHRLLLTEWPSFAPGEEPDYVDMPEEIKAYFEAEWQYQIEELTKTYGESAVDPEKVVDAPRDRWSGLIGLMNNEYVHDHYQHKYSRAYDIAYWSGYSVDRCKKVLDDLYRQLKPLVDGFNGGTGIYDIPVKLTPDTIIHHPENAAWVDEGWYEYVWVEE